MELVVTDRPTDRRTDIATYRAAIAAKNNLHSQNTSNQSQDR